MDDRLTEAAFSEQPLEKEERDLVTEIYTRLDVFEQENRAFHEKAQMARDILRLQDPEQDFPGTREKTLQLPTLKSTFNNCVADQMQNMPEARLLPETPEQEQLAMDLQDAVQYICYVVNDYERLHRRRAEDLYGPGTAITQVTWDPDMAMGKGDIALIRWPVEAFLWDPKCEDIQDARAVIKVSWHPMSWYRSHYPEAAPYISAEEGSYNDVGMPQVQKDRTGTDEPRAMLLEYWYRTYDAGKHRYSIHVAYCAGGALLDHRENVYMHGMYPFVIDKHSNIEGCLVGEGMVMELVPMMRYINKYARYIDTNLRMSSKARMLVRKNSGIDRGALADWNEDMIEGDSVVQGEDWNWMQHAPLNGMIVQQMLQMQNDLKQDSGANQFTRGETTAGVVSAKAINSLQEAGGKITGMHTDTLNDGYKRIVEQVLWLMAEFYDGERMLFITGQDGKTREVSLDPRKYFRLKKKGELAPPPYMVRIEINRRDPVQVEAQNNMFMQAYTMAAQAEQYFPLSALFRLMNFTGKERLMPVVLEAEEKQQAMQQLQQQNQQLVEQLAKMQKENDNLRVTGTQMTNALASIGATSGAGAAIQPGGKVAQAGGGPGTQAALVNRARETMAGKPAM